MQLAYLVLDIGARLLLLAVLTYYLVTNLQWYNYSLWRVLTKHHRRSWHIYYFALPLPVSYTHLTLPTIILPCRSRWSPYH